MSGNRTTKPLHFNISLSVLNHLGRKLYRSFTTVLGEAISNSWDADAANVYIHIDREHNRMCIKDDGLGMTRNDFQQKFLKIGYSKRNDGTHSDRQRPFIGRKGIGKLALLSCAKRISIISKVQGGSYVGGTIDNTGLDQAITDDLTPSEYQLENWSTADFREYTKSHTHGTIVLFEGLSERVRHTDEYLERALALYFRFSLLDKNFTIHLNDKAITIDCLDKLVKKTEFLWTLNELKDPYVEKLQETFTPERNESRKLEVDLGIKGFIASVEKPTNLKVMTTDERVGVDLFVHGRLRERNILSHMPTARVVESYLYGQVHFDGLDDEEDRFTSSRESVNADDAKFREFLKVLDRIIRGILDDWDEWRRKHREDGDPDNKRITKKQRKAQELFNIVSEEYALPADPDSDKRVGSWVSDLTEDAIFNVSSYAECFVSENLLRRYIEDVRFSLSSEAEKRAADLLKNEERNKNVGNVSIALRKRPTKLSYLDMGDMANLVDKRDPNKEACLRRDACQYKPVRDAVAHTALLTDEAKAHLTAVFNNIQARVKALLSSKSEPKKPPK